MPLSRRPTEHDIWYNMAVTELDCESKFKQKIPHGSDFVASIGLGNGLLPVTS